MTQDKPANVLISASILDKFKGTSICVYTPTFCRVWFSPYQRAVQVSSLGPYREPETQAGPCRDASSHSM